MTVLAHAPRLLIVEDDTELLGIVSDMLEEEGYHVTPAASLPNSLRALKNHLFHLVLTDLFREPDQRHPLQSIQPLLAQAAPIPVGVMTAWPVADDDPDLADLAFLLRKPFDLVDLLGKVDAELHPTIRSFRQQTLVEQFFLAINTRDWQLLTRLCTPNIKVAPPVVASSIPVGLPSYLNYLEQWFIRWPDYTIQEAKLFTRQDDMAARYIATWHSHDGRPHRAAGSMRFHFRNGRIAQIEGAFYAPSICAMRRINPVHSLGARLYSIHHRSLDSLPPRRHPLRGAFCVASCFVSPSSAPDIFC